MNVIIQVIFVPTDPVCFFVTAVKFFLLIVSPAILGTIVANGVGLIIGLSIGGILLMWFYDSIAQSVKRAYSQRGFTP